MDTTKCFVHQQDVFFFFCPCLFRRPQYLRYFPQHLLLFLLVSPSPSSFPLPHYPCYMTLDEGRDRTMKEHDTHDQLLARQVALNVLHGPLQR